MVGTKHDRVGSSYPALLAAREIEQGEYKGVYSG